MTNFAHHTLNQEAVSCLLASGWSPDRQVDEEILKSLLVLSWPTETIELQLRLFPAAFLVLREFHGLSIALKNHDGSLNFESLYFEPLQVIENTRVSSEFPHTEWSLNSSVFPIGYLKDANAYWAVDMAGHIVDPDDPAIMFGNNIYEAINSFVGFKPYQKAPHHYDEECGTLLKLWRERFEGP